MITVPLVASSLCICRLYTWGLSYGPLGKASFPSVTYCYVVHHFDLLLNIISSILCFIDIIHSFWHNDGPTSCGRSRISGTDERWSKLPLQHVPPSSCHTPRMHPGMSVRKLRGKGSSCSKARHYIPEALI